MISKGRLFGTLLSVLRIMQVNGKIKPNKTIFWKKDIKDFTIS